MKQSDKCCFNKSENKSFKLLLFESGVIDGLACEKFPDIATKDLYSSIVFIY